MSQGATLPTRHAARRKTVAPEGIRPPEIVWEIAQTFVFDANVAMEDVCDGGHKMVSIGDLSETLSHRPPSSILAAAAARKNAIGKVAGDRAPSDTPSLSGHEYKHALKVQSDHLLARGHALREYDSMLRDIDAAEKRSWRNLSSVVDM